MSIQIEISKFNKVFKTYSKDRNESSIERALELLNEMKEKCEDGLLKWLLGEGKTLLLQENLRHTSYIGNKGDNAKGTLNDFNAFALLDTVSIYNRKTWYL